jgi:hypothetical protein
MIFARPGFLERQKPTAGRLVRLRIILRRILRRRGRDARVHTRPVTYAVPRVTRCRTENRAPVVPAQRLDQWRRFSFCDLLTLSQHLFLTFASRALLLLLSAAVMRFGLPLTSRPIVDHICEAAANSADTAAMSPPLSQQQIVPGTFRLTTPRSTLPRILFANRGVIHSLSHSWER